MAIDKIVLVTQRTRLEELLERFNTRDQARFYIEHMGLDFSDYDREHDTYWTAVARVRRDIEALCPRFQQIERGLLPNFIFTPRDLVVTVGRDGLVVNTAKYLDNHPVVAVNPDPTRWDGVLLPFDAAHAGLGVRETLEGTAGFRVITMAEATLNDGQRLLAFNDFLIGHRSHVSARYSLTWRGRTEPQSSSGVLVATGAGSSGWLSSTLNMAGAVARLLLNERAPRLPALELAWDERRLVFVVREPFSSRTSGISLTAGLLDEGEQLRLESHMPEGGVIFSDGMEADALAFRSGSVATIGVAGQRTRLVVAPAGSRWSIQNGRRA
jgi:NAD kinase